MVQMVIERPTEYQYVIDVYKTNLPIQSTQHHVHGTLERARCIDQTERHTYEFEQPFSCNKCRFGNVLFADGDLPIPRREVDGGEVLGSTECIQCFTDEWQRV